MESPSPDRLRPHPDQRFTGQQHAFDLAAAAQTLRAELQSGQAGHRQTSLYKHGPTSVSLFLFGRLTRLPPHRTNGVVCIQVLKGHLRVMADGATHDLKDGGLLVLAPRVEHDVVAHVESEMLLTIHLDPG